MKPQSQFDGSALRKRMAVIALLVFIVFSLVQVAHFHPTGADHPNCSLCLTAHCVAAATQISTAPAIAFVCCSDVPSQPQLVSRLYMASNFIRPPPATA